MSGRLLIWMTSQARLLPTSGLGFATMILIRWFSHSFLEDRMEWVSDSTRRTKLRSSIKGVCFFHNAEMLNSRVNLMARLWHFSFRKPHENSRDNPRLHH